MSELRRALEAIIRITNVIPSTYRTEAIAEIANTAQAALSNEEAGEAARREEKTRLAENIASDVAYWIRYAANDESRSDHARTLLKQVAKYIERGDWKATSTTWDSISAIPTVNGTDEPPNAILAGVIPSDAGRTDYEAWAEAIVQADLDRRSIVGTPEGPSLRYRNALKADIAAVLRSAGGRVELVEREE